MEAPKLLKFPPEVLLKVCEDSGYEACQHLRKTNWELRNFVDRFSPCSQIKSIQVRHEIPSEIYLIVKFLIPKEPNLDLRYTDEKNRSCSIVKNATQRSRKETILESSNFIEIFSQDFAILLKSLSRQRIPIEEFTVKSFVKGANQLFENLKKVLSQGKLIESTKLTLRIYHTSEFQSILPFLAPKTLKEIIVENGRRSVCKAGRNMNLMEISKLEVWKNAEVVEIRDFIVKFPSRFLHFTKFHAEFNSVTLDDLKRLKQVFFATNTPKMFKIHLSHPTTHPQHAYANLLGRYTIQTVDYGYKVYRIRTPYGDEGNEAHLVVSTYKIFMEMGYPQEGETDKFGR